MNFIYKQYEKSEDHTPSPFRYPGGKFYALKHIMPFIACVPHDEYREPFVGGGSVFFGKTKAQISWINDLNTRIINVYNFITNDDNRAKLVEILTNEIATKSRHKEIKDLVPSSIFEQVFQTYYLNRTSYSGIINAPAWGYSDGKSSPPQNWGSFLNKAAEKLKNTKITNLDFEAVVKTPSKQKVLMYLDPPYYYADQKRAYEKSFTVTEHIRLAAALRNTNFYFCLSYDDCAEIRQLYDWANIYEVSWLYNTKNCKRIKRKKGQEVIITNYQVFGSDKQYGKFEPYFFINSGGRK